MLLHIWLVIFKTIILSVLATLEYGVICVCENHFTYSMICSSLQQCDSIPHIYDIYGGEYWTKLSLDRVR